MASQARRADRAGRRLQRALAKTARNRSHNAVRVALRAYLDSEYADGCKVRGHSAPALRRIRRAKLNKKHLFNVCEVDHGNALAVTWRSAEASGQNLADAVRKSASPSAGWRAGREAVVLFEALGDQPLETGRQRGSVLVLSDFQVSEHQTVFVGAAAAASPEVLSARPRNLGIDKRLFEKLQSAFARLLGVEALTGARR